MGIAVYLVAAATTTGPSWFWYATRGLGIATLILLTATVVLGIGTARRWSAESTPGFVLANLHRNLSLLALLLILGHVVTTVLDPYAHITVRDALVPIGAAYRPIWLGLGVVASEILVAIAASSLLRRLVGAEVWRVIHWAAYAFVAPRGGPRSGHRLGLSGTVDDRAGRLLRRRRHPRARGASLGRPAFDRAGTGRGRRHGRGSTLGWRRLGLQRTASSGMGGEGGYSDGRCNQRKGGASGARRLQRSTGRVDGARLSRPDADLDARHGGHRIDDRDPVSDQPRNAPGSNHCPGWPQPVHCPGNSRPDAVRDLRGDPAHDHAFRPRFGRDDGWDDRGPACDLGAAELSISPAVKALEPAGSRPTVVRRLLAGPDPATGYERLEHHQRRLPPRPNGGRWLVDVLARSGLLGRGGGRFPTWRKWEAVAEHARRRAVIVVNASEGEPLSAKDRTLLTLRPHLVLDGAALAANTLAADEIVLYLSRGSRDTRHAVRQAVKERRRARLAEPPIRIVETEHRYIAGESSAVVQRISGGPAKPQFTPPHPTDKGVNGQPTLVQNTETLAHVALIARFGSEWFRELGSESSPGTALMTLSGNIREPGVYEVDLAGRMGALVQAAGGTTTDARGALLGGYFGTWLPSTALADLTFDAQRLRSEHGASLGCGVLALLPEQGCGIVEASRILRYLAAETAGQCGPCVNGLADLSKAMARIAASQAAPADLDRVLRWSAMVRGRGACHHPDGAVGQLASALEVFADHLRLHLVGLHCPGQRAAGFPPPPSPPRWWRW